MARVARARVGYTVVAPLTTRRCCRWRILHGDPAVVQQLVALVGTE